MRKLNRPHPGCPKPEPALKRHHGQETSLYAKRLERGRVVWPQAKDGNVSLTPAMLSMLEGIDWRAPQRTWRPEMAG